jgi:hypothetical protein
MSGERDDRSGSSMLKYEGDVKAGGLSFAFTRTAL